MRILILGLPGSGTSAIAECYFRAGFSNCPPTFAKVDYGYECHESLLGRAVNRIIVGSDYGPQGWPLNRWHHEWKPRNPWNDPEVRHLAMWFMREMDERHGNWFFKNPETLQGMAVWNRYEWDEIVGVYRHPEEAIRSLHSSEKACYRRHVWNRYGKALVRYSTKIVRFPDGVADLADELGVTNPIIDGRPRTRVGYDPAAADWCASTWRVLEAAHA